MTEGVVRFVVARTLVVALTAALVAAPVTACARADRTPVPPALVGRWRGGTHGNGAWVYEFSADGGYRAWPESSPDTLNSGTVAVAGTAITFTNGGAPVTSTWSVAGDTLVLDGDTYLRV